VLFRYYKNIHWRKIHFMLPGVSVSLGVTVFMGVQPYSMTERYCCFGRIFRFRVWVYYTQGTEESF